MESKIISVNKNDYGELGLYEVIMKAQSELARLVNEEIEKLQKARRKALEKMRKESKNDEKETTPQEERSR